MTKLSVTLAGLSILVGSFANKRAEVGMINPSKDHLLPSDLPFAATHTPLLVARRENFVKLEGHAIEFPLHLGARARWFDQATSLDELIGWSLQDTEVRFPDLLHTTENPNGEASLQGSLTFDLRPVHRDDNGCNPGSGHAKWSSLEWIASFNEICSAFRLAPEWTSSPHVAARVFLQSGNLTGDAPVEENGGLLAIQFSQKDKHAVFTDAMRYEVTTDEPSVFISSRAQRARVVLKPKMDDAPIRLWFVSLDDELDGHRHGLMDHFVLYSLLPWRFRVPKFKKSCPGAGDTQGGCISGRFLV